MSGEANILILSFKKDGILELQFQKANAPIFLTLFGISIFVKDVQPENVASSIFVRLFGISTFIKDVH